METKKKIFIAIGASVLVAITVGIFGYKKGWFKKAIATDGDTGSTAATQQKDDEKIAASILLSQKAASPEVAKIAQSFGLKPDQYGRYSIDPLSAADRIKYYAALNKIGVIGAGQGKGK